MKLLLILIVLVLAGCNSEQADKTTKLVPTPTNEITPLAPNQTLPVLIHKGSKAFGIFALQIKASVKNI